MFHTYHESILPQQLPKFGYTDFEIINRDSEDADGPVELLSTGWHRFVASKATWKPCDTPEISDSEPRTGDEDEEEEDEDNDDDEDKEEEDEEEKDEDEESEKDEEPAEDSEPAENDEDAEDDAEVVAEESMHENTMERTEPAVEPHTGSTANPESDLEEIEPDAELRSRAKRLQQSRKRQREVDEVEDHDGDERQGHKAQRRRLR